MLKKYWRTGLLLVGILLVLASFTAYGLRVAQTVMPAGASEAEIEQLRHEYGLEGPVALQYAAFSFLFLPGLIVVAVWGTLVARRPDPIEMPYARVFLALVMVANGITAFNYLLQAPPLDAGYPLHFWLNMLLIGLVLAGFAFALVIWHGTKWGVWAYGISACLVFVMSFIGGIPLATTCLGPLGLIILYVLIRPVWVYMD